MKHSKSWPVNCCKSCKNEGIVTNDEASENVVKICYPKPIRYTFEKPKAGINSKPSCLSIEKTFPPGEYLLSSIPLKFVNAI